jgi:hypothetical protein
MDMLRGACQYDSEEVACLATTGIAASLFDGQTFDRWAGFNPQLLQTATTGRTLDEAALFIAKHLLENNPKAYMRWCVVKCLLLDEGIFTCN